MDNIHATIQELEKKKAAIESAITALWGLNGIATKNGNGLTIVGAVLAHLKKVGGKQTSEDLRQAVRAAGVNATNASIQTILSRRARLKKDLLHKGHGLWELKG